MQSVDTCMGSSSHITADAGRLVAAADRFGAAGRFIPVFLGIAFRQAAGRFTWGEEFINLGSKIHANNSHKD